MFCEAYTYGLLALPSLCIASISKLGLVNVTELQCAPLAALNPSGISEFGDTKISRLRSKDNAVFDLLLLKCCLKGMVT
ncbi:hypothetical protein B0J14DRAFT_604260 [Halenospora varia]|nr:hypothetical protein B0J14DRAFT_604260 [Halenospora varia]